MNKRDLNFIKSYVNDLSAMHDYYNDLLTSYNNLPPVFKSICTPIMERMEKKWKWANDKLQKIKDKYGEEVIYELMNKYDGYSN
jgi:hypothetical protein